MMSVLIADPDPQSRYLLRRALVGEWKLGIAEVDNGVAALERISENVYQLLILDQSLPLLDGLEVLEVLRAEPRTSTLPVVVTGKDVTEARLRRIIELSITDFIVKPLSVERLSSRLNRIVKQLVEAEDEHDQPGHEIKPTGVAAAERALVIEASAPFRQLLLTLLRKRVTAVGVGVGTQAIRAAVEQPPDVVFVGEDTGILRGSLLVNKLKSLPDCRMATFVAILPADQELDADSLKLYQGTLRRTTREDLLEEGLVEIFRGQEVKAKLQHKLANITEQVGKTAVEVFEILTGCEVHLSPVTAPESIAGDMAVMDLPVVGTDTVLRLGVRAQSESIRQLASWLGTEIPEDAPAGVADLLAESMNLVAGGLKNWLIDDGLDVKMSMPEDRTPLAQTQIEPLQVTLKRDNASATLFVELTRS